MKTVVCILSLVTLLAGVCIAQLCDAQTQQPQPAQPPQTGTTPTPPAPAQPGAGEKQLGEVLSWMVGQWEGAGVSQGDREFIGRLSATVELDGSTLLLRRESATKDGSTAGGLKELMVIGMDGTTKKIAGTLHTSNNFIGVYVGELKQNEIIFSLVGAQQGYTDRRIFRMNPDGGLSFAIERGTPQSQVSKAVEINFRKR